MGQEAWGKNNTKSNVEMSRVLGLATDWCARNSAIQCKKKWKGFCSFPMRLIISGVFVERKICFDSFYAVYRSLSCKQSYKKAYEAQS